MDWAWHRRYSVASARSAAYSIWLVGDGFGDVDTEEAEGGEISK